MSYEDFRRIEALKREIYMLKCSGDDQQNQQDRRSCYSLINQIKDKYETPESKKHKEELKSAREDRAYEKRAEISRKKLAKEIADLKTITPKQVAINKICDINYTIRNLRYYPSYLSAKGRSERSTQLNKIWAKKSKIMSEFGLKSTDIRRQKKFDKRYV